jgi:hypothetical protein
MGFRSEIKIQKIFLRFVFRNSPERHVPKCHAPGIPVRGTASGIPGPDGETAFPRATVGAGVSGPGGASPAPDAPFRLISSPP